MRLTDMSEWEDLFGEWATATVVVRDLVGHGAEGEIYDTPRVVDGVFVEHKRRLVRASDGRETVSETTLYAGPDAADIPVGASVTLPDNSKATALVSARMPSFEGSTGHLVVNLT
jgi:hypothetical protein